MAITASSALAQQGQNNNQSMMKQAPAKLQQQPQQPKNPNQQVIPEQDRPEQPQQPPSVPNVPVNPPASIKGITGLKLAPPMKRDAAKPSVDSDTAAAKVDDFVWSDDLFDWHLSLFRELEGAEQAGQVGEIGKVKGLEGSAVGPDATMPDLGLGANEGGKFGNPNDVPGGGERRDGLGADAPPSGFDTATSGLAGKGDGDTVATYYDDGSVSVRHGDGTVTDTRKNVNDDGSVTVSSSTQSPDGSTSSSEVTTRTNPVTGAQETVTREVGPDGTRTERHESVFPGNGNGGVIEWRQTSDGAVSARNGQIYNGGLGIRWTPWTSYPSASSRRYMPRHVGGGGADNPGDEPTASQKALGNWLMRQHNLGRNGPVPPRDMGVKVNPGDPDYEGATVPGGSLSAAFGDDIAVNPNPDETTGGGISDEKLKQMNEQMREGARGPGQGPEPEDNRGNR